MFDEKKAYFRADFYALDADFFCGGEDCLEGLCVLETALSYCFGICGQVTSSLRIQPPLITDGCTGRLSHK